MKIPSLYTIINFKIFILIICCSFNSYSGDNPHKIQNDIVLEAELSKKKAKLFEPFEVKFRYINKGNADDSVYYIFDDACDYLRFNITDENGRVFDRKEGTAPEPSINPREPHYIVAPGDTLIMVMRLVSFGKYTLSNDSSFFENPWYFPPGKYHGYAYVVHDVFDKKVFDPALKSNNIEFEILDLTHEDKEVLKLYKQHKYDEIKEKFSSNDFIEQIYRQEIREISRKIHEKNLEENGLIEPYITFFSKYPNSFYNINYLGWYVTLISDNNASSIKNSIMNLIEKFPNSAISEYLSNGYTQNLLTESILKYKAVYK
jgi:hypothetical protein